jgi:hypothetical protein
MSDRGEQGSNDLASLTRHSQYQSHTAAPRQLLEPEPDIELDQLRQRSPPPTYAAMADSNDAVIAQDAGIEHERRERQRNGFNGARLKSVSPTPEMDEEAPLLSDAGSSYNGRDSADGRGHHNEPEWFGHAELRGLPWWKKPSVRTVAAHLGRPT